MSRDLLMPEDARPPPPPPAASKEITTCICSKQTCRGSREGFMILHGPFAHELGVGMHTDRLEMKLLMRKRVLAQVWASQSRSCARGRQSEAFKREQAADSPTV